MAKIEHIGDLDPNLDCAISIIDATASDDGVWTCHAKENVRQMDFVEVGFKISVASPYAVSLASPGGFLWSMILAFWSEI